MLTPAQVRHIAKLARLGISTEECEKFSKQLSDIFAYVEKLNGVDVKGVEPTSQVTGLKNVMRKDETERFSERDMLLKCSELPLEKEQIKVQSVIVL